MKFLPARKKESHKGDYGNILVVAGSLKYPGAAVIASHAAIRAGAGLVSAAVPLSAYNAVASKIPPEIIMLPYSDENSGRLSSQDTVNFLCSEIFSENNECRYDSILIGPGLMPSKFVASFISGISRRLAFEKSARPTAIVIDADGINSLAYYSKRSDSSGRELPLLTEYKVVMTPHPGEAGRLLNIPKEKVINERFESAVKIAKRWRCVCVLKGSETIVTDGEKVYRNKKTGNPGMAVAGSGDALSGIIAAFACIFRDDIFNAASLGVFVHGLAGDIAASKLGQTSLVASDIIANLPLAIRRAKTVFNKKIR